MPQPSDGSVQRPPPKPTASSAAGGRPSKRASSPTTLPAQALSVICTRQRGMIAKSRAPAILRLEKGPSRSDPPSNTAGAAASPDAIRAVRLRSGDARSDGNHRNAAHAGALTHTRSRRWRPRVSVSRLHRSRRCHRGLGIQQDARDHESRTLPCLDSHNPRGSRVARDGIDLARGERIAGHHRPSVLSNYTQPESTICIQRSLPPSCGFSSPSAASPRPRLDDPRGATRCLTSAFLIIGGSECDLVRLRAQLAPPHSTHRSSPIRHDRDAGARLEPSQHGCTFAFASHGARFARSHPNQQIARLPLARSFHFIPRGSQHRQQPGSFIRHPSPRAAETRTGRQAIQRRAAVISHAHRPHRIAHP